MENGTEKGNLNKNTVTNVLILSKEIDKGKILKKNKTESEKKEAEQKAKDILKAVAPTKDYKNVKELIAVANGKNIDKEEAEKALKMLAAAVLVADRTAIGQAMKAELRANLTESFDGIEEYVDNNLLVSAPDDKVGQEIVKKLVGLEEINEKYRVAPNTYKKQREDEVKKVIEELIKTVDEIENNKSIYPDFDNVIKLGAVIGSLDSTLRPADTRLRPPTGEDDEEMLPGDIRAHANPEDRYNTWQITEDELARAFKEMGRAYWQTYTPSRWFKNIDFAKLGLDTSGMSDAQKLEQETIMRGRIECMLALAEGAVYVNDLAGKDTEKLRENPMYKKFSPEKMKYLMNDDFKLILSFMLHELCDKPELDSNGMMTIHYKEKPDGTLNDEVRAKLHNIRDFKESLAKFIANYHGRSEPNWMDKMNGYSAWNMFFMFGDSSLADRGRNLGTLGEVINDGIRTFNPEGKSRSKWNVKKDDMFGSEWFGTQIGRWAHKVMRLEESIDRPLNGKKTLKQQLIDKGPDDIHIMDYKMAYGFFDFVGGSKYLCDPISGKKFYDTLDKSGNLRAETLSTLLWNYIPVDDKGKQITDGQGKVVVDKNYDFTFIKQQVDFLNLYRDQQETASVGSMILTGKEKIDSLEAFVNKIHTVLGMVDDIEINGKNPYYHFAHSPDFWRDMLVSIYGSSTGRLSTNYIRLKGGDNVAYNLFVQQVFDALAISKRDVDIVKLAQRLGVNMNKGEKLTSLGVTIKTEGLSFREKLHTKFLYRKAFKSGKYGRKSDLTPLDEHYDKVRREEEKKKKKLREEAERAEEEQRGN